MRVWIGCGVAAVVTAAAAFVAGRFAIGVYNDIVRREVAVDAAWSQVENLHERRLDLIPNLVETVEGAAGIERQTLTAVTEARARASELVLSPEILDDRARFRQFQQIQDELSGALARLLATVEAYPDLKASQSFLELRSQLESTENRIAVERRRFNEAVQAYNTAIRVFPGSLVAGFLRRAPKVVFEAEASDALSRQRPPDARPE